MGSRKWSLAVVALAVVGAAGCVNGDASGNQAADAMENAGLSAEESTCVGNRLEDRLTQEQLNEVAKTGDLSELAGVDVAQTDEDHDLREFTRGVLSQCLETGGETDSAEETDAESGDGGSNEGGDETGGS